MLRRRPEFYEDTAAVGGLSRAELAVRFGADPGDVKVVRKSLPSGGASANGAVKMFTRRAGSRTANPEPPTLNEVGANPGPGLP